MICGSGYVSYRNSAKVFYQCPEAKFSSKH